MWVAALQLLSRGTAPMVSCISESCVARDMYPPSESMGLGVSTHCSKANDDFLYVLSSCGRCEGFMHASDVSDLNKGMPLRACIVAPASGDVQRYARGSGGCNSLTVSVPHREKRQSIVKGVATEYKETLQHWRAATQSCMHDKNWRVHPAAASAWSPTNW